MKRIFVTQFVMLVILAELLVQGLTAAEAKSKVKFFRPSEPGTSFICDIDAETGSFTVLTTNDGAATEKKSTCRVSISGVMAIKTVTDYGRPSKIEFKVEKAKGDVAGQDVKFASEGKTLEIDLESTPCGFRIKDGKEEIGKNEYLLLSIAFRKTRKETLADFIGTENEVGVGDSWKAPTAYLQEEFGKRGIAIKDLDFKGDVKFTGVKGFRGFECFVFDARLKAERGRDFAFEFQAEVWLPSDGKTGALKMSRTGSEKVVKDMVGKSNPVIPDLKEMSVTITDKMDVTMLPQKEKNEKK